MSTRRSIPKPLLIALAATVGMLWFGGTASACVSKGSSTPRACCAKRPALDCGCCVAAPSDARPEPDALAASPGRVLETAPTPSCECRAGEPTEPASRPSQRAAVERTEAGVGEVLLALVPAARPASAAVHRQAPNESHRDAPLFLRNSRLLI